MILVGSFNIPNFKENIRAAALAAGISLEEYEIPDVGTTEREDLHELYKATTGELTNFNTNKATLWIESLVAFDSNDLFSRPSEFSIQMKSVQEIKTLFESVLPPPPAPEKNKGNGLVLAAGAYLLWRFFG